MARLMAVPIRGRGNAVLIVSNCGGVMLMGFVAEVTLEPFFDTTPSTGECLDFVDRHLTWFETALQRKSANEAFCETQIACVEIVAADLIGIGVAKHCWN